MTYKERRIRNMLARVFEPYCIGGPRAWEACDIPGRARIDEAIRYLKRQGFNMDSGSGTAPEWPNLGTVPRADGSSGGQE